MCTGKVPVLSSHIKRYVHETEQINLDLICDDDDDEEEEEEETVVAWKLHYSHFACISDIVYFFNNFVLVAHTTQQWMLDIRGIRNEFGRAWITEKLVCPVLLPRFDPRAFQIRSFFATNWTWSLYNPLTFTQIPRNMRCSGHLYCFIFTGYRTRTCVRE